MRGLGESFEESCAVELQVDVVDRRVVQLNRVDVHRYAARTKHTMVITTFHPPITPVSGKAECTEIPVQQPAQLQIK